MTWHTLYSVGKRNALGGITRIRLQRFQATAPGSVLTLPVDQDADEPVRWQFSDNLGFGVLNMTYALKVLNTSGNDFAALAASTPGRNMRIIIDYNEDIFSGSFTEIFTGILDKQRIARPVNLKRWQSDFATQKPYMLTLNFVSPLSMLNNVRITTIRKMVNESANSTHDNSKLSFSEYIRFCQQHFNSPTAQGVVNFFQANHAGTNLRKWFHRALIDLTIYDDAYSSGKIISDLAYLTGNRIGYSNTHNALMVIDYLALTEFGNPFFDDSDLVEYDLEPYFVDFQANGWPGVTPFTLNEQVYTFEQVLTPDDRDLVRTLEQYSGTEMSNEPNQNQRWYNNSNTQTVFRFFTKKLDINTDSLRILRESDDTDIAWSATGKGIWDNISGLPGLLYNASMMLNNVLFADRRRLSFRINRFIDPMLPLRIQSTVSQNNPYGLQNITFRPVKGTFSLFDCISTAELIETGQISQSMNFNTRKGVPFSQWIWAE